jgi:outer membrane protein OmpA-like peptidoglycan-associated protein
MYKLSHMVAAVALTASMSGLAGCSAPEPLPALTIAVTGTSHEPAVDVGTVTPQVQDHAINALYPGDGAVKIVVQGRPAVIVDLTPMRGDDVEADTGTAEALVAEKLGFLADAISQGAATDGNDTLGVLDQAIQVTPVGGTIILLSSGISTVAPVDLNKAGSWTNGPDAFVGGINPADLPDATGRRIVFAGIGYGDPGGAQPTAGPAPRNALRAIWQGICKAIGATSCTIVDGPAGTGPSTAANKVPVVSFDQVETHCVGGTTTLSADIAFGPDSSKVKKAVDKILKPIAKALAACPDGVRVDAYGHAATVPGQGDGVKLSKRRARGTLDRLIALGAPESTIGKAVGYGSKSHQPVNNMPGGKYDEQLARLNRVVEIVITTR